VLLKNCEIPCGEPRKYIKDIPTELHVENLENSFVNSVEVLRYSIYGIIVIDMSSTKKDLSTSKRVRRRITVFSLRRREEIALVVVIVVHFEQEFRAMQIHIDDPKEAFCHFATQYCPSRSERICKTCASRTKEMPNVQKQEQTTDPTFKATRGAESFCAR
jgi:hypothetical protein